MGPSVTPLTFDNHMIALQMCLFLMFLLGLLAGVLITVFLKNKEFQVAFKEVAQVGAEAIERTAASCKRELDFAVGSFCPACRQIYGNRLAMRRANEILRDISAGGAIPPRD